MKYEPLEQTTCCWVGQSKQNQMCNMFKFMERESVLPQDEAEMDTFLEVLQGIAAQVCMDVIQ